VNSSITKVGEKFIIIINIIVLEWERTLVKLCTFTELSLEIKRGRKNNSKLFYLLYYYRLRYNSSAVMFRLKFQVQNNPCSHQST